MEGKSTVSVELIRENEDGSADCVVEMTQEEMEAFARIGIVAALEKAARVDEKGKQRHDWVGLTTEEVKNIVDSATSDNDGYDIFTDGTQVAFLVEAKLKEKNT